MIILIDDDKIMHLSWILRATRAGHDIKCFFSVDDFFNDVTKTDKNTTIYIDSDLGYGLKGEIESKRIFEIGITKIFLTTGYTDIDHAKYPWLTGIISKHPPF